MIRARVRCPACRGEKLAPGARACRTCRGSGRAIVEEPEAGFWTPRLELWFRTFAAWRSGHVLPDAGGYTDQAATWAEAASILEGIIGEHESAEREAAERSMRARPKRR